LKEKFIALKVDVRRRCKCRSH